MSGEILGGKYELLGRIREGGMGAIYRARHIHLDSLCVVKRMHATLEADDKARERFRREAQTAVRIHHPNVVRFFDYALREDGTAFLIMEYIPGVDIAEFLRTTPKPPLGVALEIARQGLLALGALHRMDILHRDISPENLMLTLDPDGRLLVKLIDLGLAKPATDRGLTASGIFVGKLKYGSPEQLGPARSSGPDGRADLYSFAVVLYQMLAGSAPFDSDSPGGWVYAHLYEPPKPFQAIAPDVPEDVRRAVMRCLAKSPDERFVTAEEFAAALEPARLEAGGAGLPETAREIQTAIQRKNEEWAQKRTPPPPEVPGAAALTVVAERTRPAGRRAPLALMLGALGLVAFAAYLVWAGLHPAPNLPVPAATAPTVAPANGSLALTSTPWAELEGLRLLSNGKTVAKGKLATPFLLSLQPGSYEVTLRFAEGGRATRQFRVEAAGTVSLHVELDGYDVASLVRSYVP